MAANEAAGTRDENGFVKIDAHVMLAHGCYGAAAKLIRAADRMANAARSFRSWI
ncbi:hypothetical protein GCM10010909_28980 [Acidocella aquatica]|uniref:Uncharacterized protein n=1 Tax=Acidocella aquatica TaxID=1922313 RepID=A0ABQ6AAA1_9PROT|nr:hypothetical protein GCM10010909_28980 [Acidocella aquatica]